MSKQPTTAPNREQVAKWAQKAGFTVRNGVIKVVHSNGSWVAVNDRLAEFAAIACAEGKVAQAKRQPPPPITVDLRSIIDPEMMSELLDRGLNFYGELKVMPDIIADRIAQLEQHRDELLAALEAVQAVANNSDGVAGWHMNGDIAKWDDLLPEIDDAITSVKGGVA